MSPRELLLASFRTALGAADPLKLVPAHLPAPPRGRTLVVGAGKAAAAMAAAVEQNWPPAAPLEGLVVTRYGHGLATRRIAVVEAGHPVPDDSGAAAAREMLRRAAVLGPDDLLLALVSGGGSALLAAPAAGIALAELQAVTRALLSCGAPIEEINAVRKHLSAIHGGRLAAATRAPVLALIVSDVTGDDPSDVASGPCAPDPTTYADAGAVLRRYRIEPPPAVAGHLARGARGEIAETPKPGNAVFRRVENRVIASARQALCAAADFFARSGIPAVILGEAVRGEAREVAKVYGAVARQVRQRAEPWAPPVAILSGGETTVTVRGAGRGGRCTEFLLALALELRGAAGVHALACDTDGIDGTGEHAGALLGPDSLERAARAGLDARALLEDNDAARFFGALGDLVVTGPTRTNVNDYRALLIERPASVPQ